MDPSVDRQNVKASLKLLGPQRTWAPDVREGVLKRPDGLQSLVSVRVGPERASPENVARGRAAVTILGRVRDGVLQPLEAVLGSGEELVRAYARTDGVSAARVLELLRGRAQVVPSRVAVEMVATVADALAVIYAVQEGLWRGVHVGCSPDQVLLRKDGTIRLAGATVEGPGNLVEARSGYRPPEGGTGHGTYMAAALLVELLTGEPPPAAAADPARHEQVIRRAVIQVLARPGDIPGETVGRLLQRALAFDPAARGSVADLARLLRELSARLPGTGPSAWLPEVVNAALRMSPGEASVPPLEATRPPTDLPVDPTGRSGPGQTPAPHEPSRPRSPAAAPTLSPRNAETWAGHTGMEAGDAPPLRAEPGLGPVPRAQRVTPVGLPPAGGLDRSVSIPTLGDAEGVTPAPAPGPGFSLLTAVATVVVAGFLVLAGGAAWWFLVRVPEEHVEVGAPGEAVPEPPGEATPGAGAPSASVSPAEVLAEPLPGAASPAVTPAGVPPVATSPAAAPSPVPTGPTAASPPPSSSTAASPASAPTARPRATTPVDPNRPTGSTAAAAPIPEPEEEDAGPVRIVAAVPATAAPEPPPVAAPAVAPESPGPFRVSFTAGDSSITSIEVRCLGGSGSGAGTVSVDAVDKGTTCKITGSGGETPLLAQVTVTADRSYTCFRGRSRTCQ